MPNFNVTLLATVSADDAEAAFRIGKEIADGLSDAEHIPCSALHAFPTRNTNSFNVYLLTTITAPNAEAAFLIGEDIADGVFDADHVPCSALHARRDNEAFVGFGALGLLSGRDPVPVHESAWPGPQGKSKQIEIPVRGAGARVTAIFDDSGASISWPRGRRRTLEDAENLATELITAVEYLRAKGH